MSSLFISVGCASCVFGGAVLGLVLQRVLSVVHLSKETQDTIKLGSGIIATMTAMVLGLLVSSAKNSFDSVSAAITQSGTKVMLLDHELALYGPETAPLRAGLKKMLAARIEAIWSPAGGGLAALEKVSAASTFEQQLRALTPQTESQKISQARLLALAADIFRDRALVIEQQQQPLPSVMLALLVLWLSLVFLGIGLFAPANHVVVCALLTCAFVLSSAFFLILEMSHPLDGFIRISSAPLVKAQELIGQ